MVDLDELERLEREATPGPWIRWSEESGDGKQHSVCRHEGDPDFGSHDCVALAKRSKADALLIATARNALPDLLAELRTLRARVAEMERDAAAWAKVREAVGDDAHLFEAFAEPVMREHADTGIERAPVYDRVPVAIADALRAEEGGER